MQPLEECTDGSNDQKMHVYNRPVLKRSLRIEKDAEWKDRLQKNIEAIVSIEMRRSAAD